MKRIEIGQVVVTAEEDALTLRRRGETDVELRLDASGVSELLDFLRSVRLNRFNRRRGFRVPVVSDALEVSIAGASGSAPVRVRDVSLGGIFLEWASRTRQAFDPPDEIQVTLARGGETVTMPGTVRRATDDGLGIVFSHADDAENPTPPLAFHRIVMQLEREWLAARVR